MTRSGRMTFAQRQWTDGVDPSFAEKRRRAVTGRTLAQAVHVVITGDDHFKTIALVMLCALEGI